MENPPRGFRAGKCDIEVGFVIFGALENLLGRPNTPYSDAFGFHYFCAASKQIAEPVRSGNDGEWGRGGQALGYIFNGSAGIQV